MFQISVAINQLQEQTATEFAGAAIDTGAQRTVIGRQQALAPVDAEVLCNSLRLHPYLSLQTSAANLSAQPK
jgi:hypothetical protein